MSKSNSVGTQLLVDGTAVGGLKSISGIEVSADSIDITDLGNTDGYREKLPGFKDAGEVSISGFLDGDDDGQDDCYDLLQSGDVVDMEIRFPSKIGKSWTFEAGISKFSTSASLEDAITFEATLLVSGKPVLDTTSTT